MARPKSKHITKRINIVVEEETYEQIQNLAYRTGISMSQLCRKYIQEGLDGQLGKDNMDIIAKVIREQLNAQLKPSTERICSLISKSGIMSAAAYYTNSAMLDRFVPADRRIDLEQVEEDSRKKAVSYLRNKTADFS